MYYLNHVNFLYAPCYFWTFLYSIVILNEVIILTKNVLRRRGQACEMSENNRSNHKTHLPNLKNYLICLFISHYSER